MLVGVMGLPASGKSCLCRALERRGLQLEQDGGKELEVVVLDFDELVPVVPGQQQSASPSSKQTWKARRKEALEHVRSLCQDQGFGERVVLVDDTLHLRSMRRELFNIARSCELLRTAGLGMNEQRLIIFSSCLLFCLTLLTLELVCRRNRIWHRVGRCRRRAMLSSGCRTRRQCRLGGDQPHVLEA